jgi:hypothetical protein
MHNDMMCLQLFLHEVVMRGLMRRAMYDLIGEGCDSAALWLYDHVFSLSGVYVYVKQNKSATFLALTFRSLHFCLRHMSCVIPLHAADLIKTGNHVSRIRVIRGR